MRLPLLILFTLLLVAVEPSELFKTAPINTSVLLSTGDRICLVDLSCFPSSMNVIPPVHLLTMHWLSVMCSLVYSRIGCLYKNRHPYPLLNNWWNPYLAPVEALRKNWLPQHCTLKARLWGIQKGGRDVAIMGQWRKMNYSVLSFCPCDPKRFHKGHYWSSEGRETLHSPHLP